MENKKQDFSPFFPGNELKINYTPYGAKYRSTNTTFYDLKDQYDTASRAEERAINIGCSGYRSSIINSNGDLKFFPCSSSSEYLDIIKQITPIEEERKYYDFDQRNNIFDVMYSVNDDVYSGFDYKDKILTKTLSKVLFKDPVKSSILSYFEKGFFALVESTKQIKNHFNYTVPKNNRRVF
jgi:hypothetical protein